MLVIFSVKTLWKAALSDALNFVNGQPVVLRVRNRQLHQPLSMSKRLSTDQWVVFARTGVETLGGREQEVTGRVDKRRGKRDSQKYKDAGITENNFSALLYLIFGNK